MKLWKFSLRVCRKLRHIFHRAKIWLCQSFWRLTRRRSKSIKKPPKKSTPRQTRNKISLYYKTHYFHTAPNEAAKKEMFNLLAA